MLVWYDTLHKFMVFCWNLVVLSASLAWKDVGTFTLLFMKQKKIFFPYCYYVLCFVLITPYCVKMNETHIHTNKSIYLFYTCVLCMIIWNVIKLNSNWCYGSKCIRYEVFLLFFSVFVYIYVLFVLLCFLSRSIFE